MVRKIFCDVCGRELQTSELIQLFDQDLCKACNTKVIKFSYASEITTQKAF